METETETKLIRTDLGDYVLIEITKKMIGTVMKMDCGRWRAYNYKTKNGVYKHTKKQCEDWLALHTSSQRIDPMT